MDKARQFRRIEDTKRKEKVKCIKTSRPSDIQ